MYKPIDATALVCSLVIAWCAIGCQQKSVITGDIQDAAGVSQADDGVNADPQPADTATAILAGGCFWCVESDFAKLPGVRDVVSGYSGGRRENPTYENYADGGHVEVVKVTYDPQKVSYAGLVEWLIKHSDPTDAAGSFGDRGTQYRPIVYYENELEKEAAESVIASIDAMDIYNKKLAVQVAQREKFWPAEDYHQNYAKNSLVKYDYYRYQSGRDAFIEEHWGDRAKKLELAGSIPDAKEKAATDKTLASAPKDASEKKDATNHDESPDLLWQNFLQPSDAELRRELSEIQYEVTQKDGTETAFQNEYWNNKEAGIYVDLLSGEPLYSSADKYKSGTGWPTFVRPLDSRFISLREDNTLLTSRTEVRSKIANSHLGHVFNDGPPQRGGKRWCMNSAAMKFIAKDKMKAKGYGKYVSLVEPPR